MGARGFRSMSFDIILLKRESKLKGHFYVEIEVKLMFIIKIWG
jgi:hypothetical protein